MLQEILKESGIFQYGTVNTANIWFTQEVRAMCEINACRQYGKTWVCPPAVGTIDECRARVQQYDTMLVFSVKYDLEDSFDYEGMTAGMLQFKKSCCLLDEALKLYMKEYFILSNEGCDLCSECTYPDAPCRHPGRSHGSLGGIWDFCQ